MINGHFFEDLSAGMTANLAKTIIKSDFPLYSTVSIDTNPTHVDAGDSKQGTFRERIAHSVLSAGLISGALGTKLTAPDAIYPRQSSRFAAPVKIGQTMRATVEVISINPDNKRATFRTPCTTIAGEAYVQVASSG